MVSKRAAIAIVGNVENLLALFASLKQRFSSALFSHPQFAPERHRTVKQTDFGDESSRAEAVEDQCRVSSSHFAQIRMHVARN